MKIKKALLVFLTTLVVLLAGTWVVLRTTGAGRAIVKDVLSRVLKGRFGMSDADIDILEGTAQIDDFNLADPDKPDEDLLSVKKVVVGLSQNPLELGRLNTVTLTGISLHLRLGADETPDISKLVKVADRERTGEGDALPEIRVEDSSCLLYLPGARTHSWIFRRIFLRLTPQASTGPERKYAIGGQLLSPLGATLAVTGRLAVPPTGPPRIRLRATCPEWRLTPETRTGLAGADEALAKARPEGEIDFRLWLNYPDPSGALSGGFRLGVKNLSVTPPTVPYRVTGLNGALEASTDRGGSVVADLTAVATRSSFTAKGRVDELLSGDPVYGMVFTARDVSVDSALARACRESSSPALPRIWRGLTPRQGKVDARIRLVRAAPDDPDRRPDAEVDLDFAGVDITYRGVSSTPGGFSFPYPLTGAGGRVTLRTGNRITLEGLQARADGGTIRLDGDMRVERGEGKGDLHLAIRATDFPFGPKLAAALSAGLEMGGRIYKDYSPRGRMDARIDVAQEEGEVDPRVRVRLQPKGASASYAGFPYRVDDLHGSVTFAGPGIAFDLVGRADATRVELHGRFPREKTDERMELTIKATGLVLDPRLRKGLAVVDKEMAGVWDEFTPSGLADLNLALTGQPEPQGSRLDLGVHVREAAFTSRAFPVPVTGANGRLYLTTDRQRAKVEILGLKGFAWGAPVSVYGSVTPKPDSVQPPAIDLTVLATGLPITERLATVLDRTGTMERSLFDLLAVKGKLNVIQRLVREPGGKDLTATTEVELLDLTSTSSLLPDRATGIGGTVVVGKDRIDLLYLAGDLGGAKISIPKGTIRRTAGGTEIDTTINCPAFPVDDRLARLMEPPVRKVYLAHRPRGRIRLAPLHLGFSIPKGDKGMTMRFRGAFEILEGQVDLGAPVARTRGSLTIKEGVLQPDSTRIRGTLEGMELAVAGLPLESISGAYELTDKELRLPAGSIGLAGGTLTAVDDKRDLLRLGLVPPYPLQANIDYQGIRLEKLTAQAEGITRSYRGVLTGFLLLDMPDKDPRNLKAHLRLRAKEAYIGTVPLLSDLYRMMGSRSTPSFKEGKIVAKAEGPKITFSQIALKSNFFDIDGSGTYDFTSGLDFQFKAGNQGTFILTPIITYFMKGTFRDYAISVGSPLVPLSSSSPPWMPILPTPGLLPERPLTSETKRTR